MTQKSIDKIVDKAGITILKIHAGGVWYKMMCDVCSWEMASYRVMSGNGCFYSVCYDHYYHGDMMTGD